MDKELIKLLRTLKDDSSLGGGFDADSSWKRFARDNGFDQNTVSDRYSIGDYFTYGLWKISHVLLKPVAATVAVFFLAISGWLSVANVSAHALPGDTFYSVKIGMEKAQLALAFTSQQRANLKVEFASRRLEEMVQIASLVQHRQPAEVQLAVNRFKDEVTHIQEELQVEKTSDSQTELAKTVG